METPVQIVVTGFAGPRCTVQANTTWTILQVHEAISQQLEIPVDWQTLLKETEKLGWEVTVGSVVTGKTEEPLRLSLVVEEVPDLARGEFMEALTPSAQEEALRLLRRHRLPGLNEWHWSGGTVLHRAIDCGLRDVAVVIVGRKDFSLINVKDHFHCTALHLAAHEGYLEVCEAILARGDFVEALALTEEDMTAAQLARAQGHGEVAAFLERREAELR